MTVLEDQPAAPRPLFGFGSLLLAGFIGGPPAAGVLAFFNLRTAPARARQLVLGFLVAASAVWWWCLTQVPPDALSQLLAHLPVWAVLSLPAWLMLRGSHRAHKVAGGAFRSAWAAVGIAVLVRVALAVVTQTTSFFQ